MADQSQTSAFGRAKPGPTRDLRCKPSTKSTGRTSNPKLLGKRGGPRQAGVYQEHSDTREPVTVRCSLGPFFRPWFTTSSTTEPAGTTGEPPKTHNPRPRGPQATPKRTDPLRQARQARLPDHRPGPHQPPWPPKDQQGGGETHGQPEDQQTPAPFASSHSWPQQLKPKGRARAEQGQCPPGSSLVGARRDRGIAESLLPALRPWPVSSRIAPPC